MATKSIVRFWRSEVQTKFIDQTEALSYTPTKQWEDVHVHWVLFAYIPCLYFLADFVRVWVLFSGGL